MERTVFRDVVKVVPTNDDSASHLRRDDTAGQDATTDGNIPSERALLVWKQRFASARRVVEEPERRTNVGTLNRLSGGLESKTNVLVPPLLLGGYLLTGCSLSLHKYSTFA